MHLAPTERDLINFLNDEVAKNGNGLLVLAINPELTAAGVLVQGDKRPTIGLSHGAQLLLNNVDAGGPDIVWIPEVCHINHELRIHSLEQIVTVMVLIDVAENICSFLEAKMRRSLSPVDRSLAD